MTLRHLHDHPGVAQGNCPSTAKYYAALHAAEDIAIATMELVGKPQKRKRAFCRFYWGGKPAHIRQRLIVRYLRRPLYHPMLKTFLASLRNCAWDDI